MAAAYGGYEFPLTILLSSAHSLTQSPLPACYSCIATVNCNIVGSFRAHDYAFSRWGVSWRLNNVFFLFLRRWGGGGGTGSLHFHLAKP
jgi:hypothetical protein